MLFCCCWMGNVTIPPPPHIFPQLTFHNNIFMNYNNNIGQKLLTSLTIPRRAKQELAKEVRRRRRRLRLRRRNTENNTAIKKIQKTSEGNKQQKRRRRRKQ